MPAAMKGPPFCHRPGDSSPGLYRVQNSVGIRSASAAASRAWLSRVRCMKSMGLCAKPRTLASRKWQLVSAATARNLAGQAQGFFHAAQSHLLGHGRSLHSLSDGGRGDNQKVGLPARPAVDGLCLPHQAAQALADGAGVAPSRSLVSLVPSMTTSRDTGAWLMRHG